MNFGFILMIVGNIMIAASWFKLIPNHIGKIGFWIALAGVLLQLAKLI